MPTNDSTDGRKVIPFPKHEKKCKTQKLTRFDKQSIIDSLEKPYYSFDFKEWADLSKNDPELFEQRREEVIAELIGQCRESNQHRITGIQWRIEQERKLSSSSMDSCIRIYNLMWEQVLGKNGMLESLKTM